MDIITNSPDPPADWEPAHAQSDSTALVETISVDEAYLDVTAAIGKPEEAPWFAREIKRQIRDQTELTASAGISFCKFLAKIALDAHKPDGLTVASQVAAAVFPEAILIEKFFGVGKVTADRLRDLGIQAGAELRQIGEERLRDLLDKYGGRLYRFS